MKGHELDGKRVSNDVAFDKVISSQAKIAELKREVSALRKDRELLLSEYQASLKAKEKVARLARPRRAHANRAETVRVCFGDVHGMRMDKGAVNALLSDLRSLDPDELVIGGDFIDCEGWLAKHHTVGFVANCDYSYQDDIAAGNWLLDELQKAAPRARIHFLMGNHDDRVQRWIVDQTLANARDAQFLLDAFGPVSLLKLKERGITVYERSGIYERGLPRGWFKLGKMYFTHELGRGKNAARDAALKTAGNVTYFHSHREDTASVVFPSVGLIKAFCPGCMSEMQPMYQHSDPTSWSQGYGIDFVAKSGNFQRVHVPIWRGESLAVAMVNTFRK